MGGAGARIHSFPAALGCCLLPERIKPLDCTAIERKTQPKAAWIWKIVLHLPLHPIHSYYFCSSKRLCSKGLSALTIGLAVLWWQL